MFSRMLDVLLRKSDFKADHKSYSPLLYIPRLNSKWLRQLSNRVFPKMF